MLHIFADFSDEHLFQLIQGGEEKAFDVFFLRHYAALCAYAKQFVDLEDGQEVVQDIMVWFWENRAALVIESSPRSYLFKSVRNRCLTLINRKELKQRVVHALQASMRQEMAEPDFYIMEELAKKIELAIMSLPESYREAFELNRFSNMTYKEIAEKLKVSPKTIDYRIQQSLKILRAELRDYLPLCWFFLS